MTEEREPRPCGSHSDHVGHPWAMGLYWCRGRGKVADEAHMRALEDRTSRCGTTWVGPTGIVWDCDSHAHWTDPTKGYAGSGHHMVARPRVAALV